MKWVAGDGEVHHAAKLAGSRTLSPHSLTGAGTHADELTVRVIGGAGHYLPEERPGIIAAAIREMARRQTRRRQLVPQAGEPCRDPRCAKQSTSGWLSTGRKACSPAAAASARPGTMRD